MDTHNVFAYDLLSAVGAAVMAGNNFVGLEIADGHVNVIGDLDSDELCGNNLSFGKIPVLDINDNVKFKVERDKIAPIAFTFDQLFVIASALQCYSDQLADGLASADDTERQSLCQIESDISDICNDVDDLFQRFGIVSEDE